MIDFPDEDLPPEIELALTQGIGRLHDEMTVHLAQAARGEKLRSGLFFAVTGPPNVGKSSLVNRLAGREAAIVSEWAGTTRDAIEVRLVLGDVPVTLVDTAGLRETRDPLEAEGVRRARIHAEQADLVLHVATDGGEAAAVGRSDDAILVWNKLDLAPPPDGWLGVSALTGAGFADLEDVLARARPCG